MSVTSTHYSTIIIGAGFYGCGIVAVESDSLVLESSNHVGSDFVYTFNPGSDWDAKIQLHPYAEEFRNMLIMDGVLRAHRLHCGALACVAAKWCIDHNVNVELMTDVLEYDEHKLTVFNSAGKATYSADRIMDSRPHPQGEKYITALVHHPVSKVQALSYGELSVHPGPFEDESYLSLQIPMHMNWIEARQKFHQLWQQRSEEIKDWKLVLIGSRFDFRQYPNPVAALNAGLQEGPV